MKRRLDELMVDEGLINDVLAERVECSPHYISGIRNGMIPSARLGVKICNQFPGKLTLRDLGVKVDPALLKLAKAQ